MTTIMHTSNAGEKVDTRKIGKASTSAFSDGKIWKCVWSECVYDKKRRSVLEAITVKEIQIRTWSKKSVPNER